jgi:hypothetical protein
LKDEPSNARSFMSQVDSLKTVLSETNTNIILKQDFEAATEGKPSVFLSQLDSKAPEKTGTKRMLENCERELKKILVVLKKRSQGNRLGWEQLEG